MYRYFFLWRDPKVLTDCYLLCDSLTAALLSTINMRYDMTCIGYFWKTVVDSVSCDHVEGAGEQSGTKAARFVCSTSQCDADFEVLFYSDNLGPSNKGARFDPRSSQSKVDDQPYTDNECVSLLSSDLKGSSMFVAALKWHRCRLKAQL